PTAACDCGPESARQREWRPAAAQRMASLCPLRPPGTFCGTVPPLFPEVNMLSDELRVQIRHWFYAEHWRVGTIAQQLGVHPDAFLRLRFFPGEQGQVDWAHFGEVPVGRARRRLSCFLITLSYSRALYLEFFFDQSMENFLRGHVHAFQAWSGQPRILLYDNLRSAVLERRGDQIHFHPRLLDLCAHYHFAPRPCQVRAGNQ